MDRIQTKSVSLLYLPGDKMKSSLSGPTLSLVMGLLMCKHPVS